MKTNYISSGIFLILLYSCTHKHKEIETEYKFFEAPITYPLDTNGGYTINPVSGDSIKPIINSLGDTIKTGVTIPALGKVINPDSVEKPKVVSVGKPKEGPTNTNVHPVPKNLTVIPVDESKLKKVNLGEGDSTFVLKNSVGVIIPTGIPIPAVGKKVPCKQPQPVPALPLRMKDDATYNIQYLDVDQGIYASYIRSILEDKRGNLWFGTFGISRYDGKSFTHYTKKDGLSDNRVLSILEDKNGNLWFGTDGGGISRYDGKSFTYYTEREGFSIRSILEDKNGNLWFGTEGGGVSRFDGTNFTHYTVKEGLSNNNVMCILEDKNGNLWFGTLGGGVSRFDGKSFTQFTKKEGLSNNTVRCLLEDKNENLWFGTEGGGVSRYDGKSFTHYTEKEGLSNNIVLSILEDKNGNLWFGTFGGGVSRYDGKSFTHFTEKEGLSNNIVLSILEDKNGNLWFGTFGGGVSRLYGKSFTQYTEQEGLSNIKVWSIVEDKNGNLWLGTDGGGVSRYDGKSFTQYTEKEGLTNNKVKSIVEDKNGNLWFGTDGGGVSRYDGKSFTQYTEKEGLSNNKVLSILEDKNGNLWFGTWGGGVSRFDGKSFTHYTEKEGLSNNKVLSILEDKNGNLWFGTGGGGVSRFDGTSFTSYTEKEGLSNNVVNSLLEDKNGNLWFGTVGGGVSRFDGKSFTHFTEKEGLSNNYVWSIVEDNGGNLWVSTEKGLNYFKQNKKDIEHPEIIVFKNNDGLRAIDFFNNSAFIDGKNLAWWGSGKSLVMLDLNKFSVPTESPVIYLRQLDVNEEFKDFRQLQDSSDKGMVYDAVAQFENYPLNLKLPYYKNNLTFHYCAIDWAAPQKIKYSYKLEGLKNDWSFPTEDIKADYRNLSYGNYTFKVKAIGIAQKWSQPFDYTFIILPPWWRSKWAYGLYLLIFITGAFATNRYLRKRLLHKERERNRVKELKQKASELEMQALRAQMSPHFIFNSLNSINNFILKNDKLQASDYLIKFSKLIRLILENSTLPLISLGQELEALKLYIELEALRFHHRFDYQIIFSKDLDITSIKVPPLILQPFVENAIHHGLMPKESPGHLKVTITEMEGKLLLKIEDDGIGRHKSGLINANASHKHKSLGLNVTTERIGFLNKQYAENSKIEVNDLTDEDGKALGTEISINIPVII